MCIRDRLKDDHFIKVFPSNHYIDIETNKNKCARLDLNKLTLISSKNMLKIDFLNLEQDEYLENCSRQEKLIN